MQHLLRCAARLGHPVPMSASRKGSVRRWFSSEGLRLPGHLLLAYFAFSLAALAGVALATESEGYGTLLMFVLVFGVLPALERRFGVPIEYTGVSGDVKPPPRAAARMWGLSLAFLVPWGALTYFVVPESLGAWFLFWLMLGPWLGVQGYVTKRELRRHGAHEWRPVRMLRDSALGGVATVPAIFAIMLWDGAGVGEALATGVVCGFIVFVLVVTMTRLYGARPEDETADRPGLP